jgi:hypothetical protein
MNKLCANIGLVSDTGKRHKTQEFSPALIKFKPVAKEKE